MVGEKYHNPDHYLDGMEWNDDWVMYTGTQDDINRTCFYDSSNLNNPSNAECKPQRDRPGFSVPRYAFGSAHPSTFNMVICDGSVHSISYTIDLELHRRLGNRKDKLTVDLSGF
jgi:hypothetical protein